MFVIIISTFIEKGSKGFFLFPSLLVVESNRHESITYFKSSNSKAFTYIFTLICFLDKFNTTIIIVLKIIILLPLLVIMETQTEKNK